MIISTFCDPGISIMISDLSSTIPCGLGALVKGTTCTCTSDTLVDCYRNLVTLSQTRHVLLQLKDARIKMETRH